MSIFNWFKGDKMAKKNSNVLQFPTANKDDDINDVHADYEIPEPVPAPRKRNKGREHYRIGYDIENQMATLTILNEDGYPTTTLNMNQAAAEQLIRMLRSAFPK